MTTAMSGTMRNRSRCRQIIDSVIRNIIGGSFQNYPADGRHAGAHRRKINVWYHSADPAVDAGDQGTYPVKAGDLCIRTDANGIESLWKCTESVTANTAATFVEMIA